MSQQDIIPAAGVNEISGCGVKIGSFVMTMLLYIFEIPLLYCCSVLAYTSREERQNIPGQFPQFSVLFNHNRVIIGTVAMQGTRPKVPRPRLCLTGPLAGARGYARSTSDR